ncbi:MAG: hypothetical protein M9894_33285 [Planctomycetes bacterium]|nr:hypothetical protein [Planctomycetota bacterium]
MSTRVEQSTSGRTGYVRFGRPAPSAAPQPPAAPRSTARQPAASPPGAARPAAGPRSTTRQPEVPRPAAGPRSTTRHVVADAPRQAAPRRPAQPSDYVPSTARDLPMRSFLGSAGLIVAAVALAGFFGGHVSQPGPAPVAFVQPPAPRTVAPAIVEAPVHRDYHADPLHMPVTVDPTTRVVVIGEEEERADDEGDDAPVARVREGADVLRIPPERLDEVIRVLGRDEGHRRYWLELVDGRVVDVDLETLEAVQAALPLRATYSRE